MHLQRIFLLLDLVGGKMGFAEGNPHGEDASLNVFAVGGGDLTVVELHKLVAEVESDPEALGGIVFITLSLIETLENLVDILLVESDSGIRHRYFGAFSQRRILNPTDFDIDFTLLGEFQGIRKQVDCQTPGFRGCASRAGDARCL